MEKNKEQNASKVNINWFPGHMTKARREMEAKLNLVDMVIELRDARIPYSSKNPMIEEIIQQKPRLIVLTKIDKAEKSETDKWVTHLSDDFTIVICLNVLKDNVIKKISEACKELMHAQIARQIRKGITPRAIRAMVCGIPNVGKSTLINQLAKKKATQTGDRPGVTRALQWVKVGSDLELLDTPGVLWPKFEEERVGMGLAVTGAINDQILPFEEIAYYALKYIRNGYKESFESLYGIPLIENGYKLFINLGIKRGYLSKGSEVDMKRTMESFMKDVRADKLGSITWEKVNEMFE